MTVSDDELEKHAPSAWDRRRYAIKATTGADLPAWEDAEPCQRDEFRAEIREALTGQTRTRRPVIPAV